MNDIIIHHLSKAYDGSSIFDDFNAIIPYGRTTFIQGPSAIGKTTLCRILASLEDYQGSIERLNDYRVSMIFQQDNLVGSLSILNNLRLVKPIDDDGFNQRLDQGLHAFGLYDDRHKSILTCSGGMARRVAILRALLVDFDLLIADEALKGMDIKTERIVMDHLLQVCRGKTIIWVSHHPSEMKYFDDPNIIEIG